MALLANDTASHDFVIHRGAPRPLRISHRIDGVLQELASTLRFRCNTRGTTIDLTVGSGITLTDSEGIANAEAVIALTVAQSRTIPAGKVTTYEITDGAVAEQPLFIGYLIGRGGDNSDV